MSLFARFAPRLQQAIVARLGWTHLRPVQEAAGEALLSGENAVILAPTAGGKTEAAMFPMLSHLVEDSPDGVGLLYIAPIKALLNNQAERLGTYTEMVGLRRFVWHGDTGTHPRKRFLAEPSEILMTTPESLEVMLVSPRVNAKVLFADLRAVVIDEVHALAGSDRGAHLMSVIERLARLSRHDVQRVGLSATVGNPAAILAWLQGTSTRPGRVVDPPKQPARRQVLVAHRPDLETFSRDAARLARGQKSLFFCQSRSITEAVAGHMRRSGTEVFVHHSAVSREERELAEERFHYGQDACIVCTSTLELGIDVGDLDRVMQAEAPATVSSFLQRMGRTGRRAGQAANTTFFCETSEGVLQASALIELARAGWVEPVAVEQRCWPVLIHQLLAMALASDGIPPEDVWAHLASVPDFRGIHRGEFDRLVRWMLRDGSLRMAGGRLVIGPAAEKQFGRRNFMELFAVFSSPKTYTVQTASAQPIGTLTQDFVDQLVEGVSSFLLGGRGWAVMRLQHEDRTVVVEPAPRGRQPTWGGFLPQFLGYDVCQKMRHLLLADDRPAYLDDAAWTVLSGYRKHIREALIPPRDGLVIEEGEVRWWTFAGGRINSTLRYALESLGGDWKVVPDNFSLRIRGEGLDAITFRKAVDRLNEPEFWENERLWAEVAAGLPSYRLSKFQPLMPPWIEREVVAGYLLDVGGAWRWLSGTESPMPRLPGGVGALDHSDAVRLARIEGGFSEEELAALPRLTREPCRPVHLVTKPSDLEAAVGVLRREPEVGLGVVSAMGRRTLSLVALSTREATFVVDALTLSELDPLEAWLSDPAFTKVVHFAAYRRDVLARHGLPLDGVLDTRELSQLVRGKHMDHSLRQVCARELGLAMPGLEPGDDWTQRPLGADLVERAALEAEVLLRLTAHYRVKGRPDR